MISITDKTYQPTLEEIGAYIGNPLFEGLCAHMREAYGALYDIMYSCDNVLLGWNVRFYKSGRTLCRLYPRNGYFAMLVVVGRKEKMQVEALLPGMSAAMQTLYHNTQEGMGQRWLIAEFSAPDALYQDLLRLIAIRRASK